MKEKFGQWWLDVAKYIFTGVILSSVFSDVEEKVYLYWGGMLLVGIFLTIGLTLIKKEKDKETKLKKGKKK